MASSILKHIVVPVANEDDATETCKALDSYIDDETEIITIVHVIEKTPGYMDKAPLEARQQQAERVFSIIEDYFQTGPVIQRELRYGTDVVDEILDAAEEHDATAIGFTHRESTRLQRLLSGKGSYRLTTESEQPVVVFSRIDSTDQ
ncbi:MULTISPECIES: universal stress protein [Natrialbaceae]|uniref:Nucleotide-binding universal stress protein, UspA family n=2 Tax=Natrialbaceae TaxID=1644061 RepID=A0A1N7GAR0_9EURY|nr:universal stress protein [Natronorubrum daqingense]APX98511.1 universal stress protein UspA [Natronorubrum daqingense]MCU4742189.1 universal stress protein [Halobacteria archaeon AArc-xg1-1]SIS09673.1 Nucleotide-binding universal stress protein, UspA family [Natronorubrum daqingense]